MLFGHDLFLGLDVQAKEMGFYRSSRKVLNEVSPVNLEGFNSALLAWSKSLLS